MPPSVPLDGEPLGIFSASGTGDGRGAAAESTELTCSSWNLARALVANRSCSPPKPCTGGRDDELASEGVWNLALAFPDKGDATERLGGSRDAGRVAFSGGIP
jgi:hypothetical protein